MKWYDTTVRAIIRNEKYMGDLLLGKTVTIDPITHRRVKNHGQADKYYIENHHEAIISREVFEKAQEIMESRGIKNKYKGKPQKTSNKYAFSGIMKCSFCGGTIMRRTHHAGTRHEKYVWQCSKSIRDGRKACPNSKAIDERVLKAAFIEGYSRVTKHNANLVDEFLINLGNALDMTSIENEIGSITKKITKQESISEQLIDLKLNDKIDENTYVKKFNEINKILNELKQRRDDLLKSLSEEQTLSERIKSFKSNLNTEQPMEEFDRLSFESFVENVLIGKMDDTENPHPYVVTFVLKSGLKFEGLAERQYKKKGLKLMEAKMYSSSEIEKPEPYSFYKDTTCGDCGGVRTEKLVV